MELMEMQEYINSMRIIQSSILDYINDEIESNKKFQDLVQLLNDNVISKNKENLEAFFYLLIKIYSNYLQTSSLITKVEKILLLFREDISKKFSNSEILEIFGGNKRILLFFIKENLIKIDELFIYKLEDSLFWKFEHYFEYFSPEIKSYIETEQKTDENKYHELLYNCISNDLPEDFDENRLKGTNESFICNLIRNDSIVEFIKYVNKMNLSLETKIIPSIYETNSFLLTEQPSLIEYAAFYGSIQIYQFLRMNNVKLNSSLWAYAIHGKNAEIIHLLEFDKVYPYDKTYMKCYKESIKCFHNDIANYIKVSLMNSNDDKNETTNVETFRNAKYSEIFMYHNYEFIPDNLDSLKYAFFYLCNYKLIPLARLYLKSKNIDDNFLFCIDDYECIEELGMSSFRNAFIVKNKLTNKKYFAKSSKANFDECQPDEFIKNLNQNIKLPGILNVIGYSPINYLHESNPTVLFDYFPNGSLLKYLEDKKNENLSTTDYILILGIAIGLKHLHDNEIVPIDFHPNNILIDDNFYPIISDFFISFISLFGHFYLSNDIKLVQNAYLPPEFSNNTFTYSSNIFSYSLILYHILTRKSPFQNLNERDQFIYHISNDNIDLSLINNKDIIHFLKICLRIYPEKILAIDDVLDFITSEKFYSYFKQLDYELIIKYLNTFGAEFNHLKNKFSTI